MKPTQLSLAQAPPLPTLHTLLPLRRRDPQRPAARLYHLAWIRHRDTSCTILQKLPLYRQDAVRRTLTPFETPSQARLGLEVESQARSSSGPRHPEGEEIRQPGGGRRIEIAEADHHVPELGEDTEIAIDARGPAAVAVAPQHPLSSHAEAVAVVPLV